MLSCVGCKREVSAGDGKLFAEVFVCDGCFLIASRLFERGQQELKMLLVVLKEAIRNEILQGRLQFQSADEVREVPKRDLITHLAELAEKARAQKENKCPPSPQMIPSRSTLPRVRSASSKPQSSG